jgi:hypothetical protein
MDFFVVLYTLPCIMTYMSNSVIIPFSRVFPDNILVAYLGKESPTFYGTQRGHYHIYKSPSLVLNLSHRSPQLHTLFLSDLF